MTARDDDRHRPAAQVRGGRVQDRGRATSSSSSPPPRCRSPTTTRTRSSRAASCPLNYCAFTPCFRAEAGSRRQGHPRPDPPAPVPQGGAGEVRHARRSRCRSWRRMTDDACDILRRLGLHHRVVLLCTGGHGLRLAEDLRHRGLAARPERVPGDLLLLELRRLPGPPREDPLPRARRATSRSCCTRSTARAWPSGARWWRSWRTTSARTEASAIPEALVPVHGRADGAAATVEPTSASCNGMRIDVEGGPVQLAGRRLGRWRNGRAAEGSGLENRRG